MAALPNQVTLGVPIPFVSHAISVSLPTWEDNVGYMKGEKRVVDAMASGYPRFVIHFSVKKLARICEQKFGASGERCLLYPTKRAADHCGTFLVDQSSQSGSPVSVRLIQYNICSQDSQWNEADAATCSTDVLTPSSSRSAELYIVLFPEDILPLARQCWQHTGMGISSRYAEYCLLLLEESVQPPSPTAGRPAQSFNKHHSTKSSTEIPTKVQQDLLEKKCGRNLPANSVDAAKSALRRRIASALVRNCPTDFPDGAYVAEQGAEMEPSCRDIKTVTEDDVFLFPTGMCAIWNAYNLVMMTRQAAKSICFGFLYTDTIKILQKWGQGCHFFGHGLDTDIDELECILEQDRLTSPSMRPPLALFTEFPSNPLLRSANLPRLRALADKYDFPIIIDETIGTFANVSVMPYADIVISSMSKVFSGSANVTGGSLVLNPAGRHYQKLKDHMTVSYEDTYFDEDVIYMEHNSRDFERRISVIDENTEIVCDFLRSHSIAGGVPSSVIKEIFYPKWTTRDIYEHCRVKGGGFGGLFSITFTTAAASTAFYNNLTCYKGPSLGTNFTLACPYTILAHYTELEWAAEYGVEETLVRISVGMEEKDALLHCLEAALKAAQETSESQN